MIEIINYEKRFHGDFKKRNLEWLEEYNLLEQHDLQILNDPQGEVINKGGYIFLAMENEDVVGTAGLSRENSNEYELIKMSVDHSFRGKGVGKLLLIHCIEKAKQLGAKKIFLFSNSRLQTALNLYEQFGFTHIATGNAPYLTADIRMELLLKNGL